MRGKTSLRAGALECRRRAGSTIPLIWAPTWPPTPDNRSGSESTQSHPGHHQASGTAIRQFKPSSQARTGCPTRAAERGVDESRHLLDKKLDIKTALAESSQRKRGCRACDSDGRAGLNRLSAHNEPGAPCAHRRDAKARRTTRPSQASSRPPLRTRTPRSASKSTSARAAAL
eukprot:6211745-Pleurochrysis_carterae.AAC.5